MKDAHALVGELIVALAELADRPTWPASNRRERRATFHHWFAFAEHLLRLAIDAGLAVEREPTRPAAVLSTLAAEVAAQVRLVAALHEALCDGLDDAEWVSWGPGGEAAFRRGLPWMELCVFRSGLGFLSQLAELTLDFTDFDEPLEKFGFEMFVEQPIPPGMSRDHWWWFGASP